MKNHLRPDFLNEICGNCGSTCGKHHGGSVPWPYNYCPDPAERMDWVNGPGTTFKSTGRYINEEESIGKDD